VNTLKAFNRGVRQLRRKKKKSDAIMDRVF
jgi:hypothetical protein